MSLLTSLLACYEFDETSGDADDANGSIDLTQTGSIGSVSGIISNARSFDGTSGKKFASTNAVFEMGDTDHSYSVWVKLNSLPSPTYSIIFLRTQLSGAFNAERLIIDSSSGSGTFISYRIDDGGGDAKSATWGSSVATGVWYHIVCWFDSVNNEIGISINNGTPVTTATTIDVPYTGGDHEFNVGIANGVIYADYAIDQLCAWSKVVSANEREDLYNDGHGLAYTAFTKPDSPSAELTTGLLTYHAFETGSGTTSFDSHGSNNGTLNAGVSWASGQVGGGVSFDGSDDNITIPAIAAITGLTEISVMIWAKPLSAGGASFGRIFHSDDVNPFGLLMNSASNSIQWLINGGSGLSVGAVTASAWNFIIGTYDSVALRVYVAGALAGSGAYTSVLNACSTIYLSDRSSTGRAFEGSMDEAAIWSRRLTPWERRYLYNSGAGRTYTDFAGGAAAPAATPSLFGIINNPVAMGF